MHFMCISRKVYGKYTFVYGGALGGAWIQECQMRPPDFHGRRYARAQESLLRNFSGEQIESRSAVSCFDFQKIRGTVGKGGIHTDFTLTLRLVKLIVL